MPLQLCYSTAAAAAFLGVDVQVLASWRARGIGPAYLRMPSAFGRNHAPKAGGVIRYPLPALEQFIAEMTVPAGRLPHPAAGRPRGSRNRPKHSTAIPDRK